MALTDKIYSMAKLTPYEYPYADAMLSGVVGYCYGTAITIFSEVLIKKIAPDYYRNQLPKSERIAKYLTPAAYAVLMLIDSDATMQLMQSNPDSFMFGNGMVVGAAHRMHRHEKNLARIVGTE